MVRLLACGWSPRVFGKRQRGTKIFGLVVNAFCVVFVEIRIVGTWYSGLWVNNTLSWEGHGLGCFTLTG